MKKNLTLIIALHCFSIHAQAPGSKQPLFEKPDDFAYHVYAGMAIGAGTGAIVYKYTKRAGLSTFAAWSVAVLAGGLKEGIYDKLMKRGVPTKKDFFGTAWGATVSVPLVRCGIDIHERKIENRAFWEHYGDSLRSINDTITPIKFD